MVGYQTCSQIAHTGYPPAASRLSGGRTSSEDQGHAGPRTCVAIVLCTLACTGTSLYTSGRALPGGTTARMPAAHSARMCQARQALQTIESVDVSGMHKMALTGTSFSLSRAYTDRSQTVLRGPFPMMSQSPQTEDGGHCVQHAATPTRRCTVDQQRAEHSWPRTFHAVSGPSHAGVQSSIGPPRSRDIDMPPLCLRTSTVGDDGQ